MQRFKTYMIHLFAVGCWVRSSSWLHKRISAQEEAINHLHPRPPADITDANLVVRYTEAVRSDLFGDDMVCEALCWRYDVAVFMFLPILANAPNARSSIPRPKQYNRRPGAAGSSQKVIFILATDLGVQHFEPIVPVPGVPARQIPSPSYFTAADRARENEEGFCIATNQNFTTVAMRNRVRSSVKCTAWLCCMHGCSQC